MADTDEPVVMGDVPAPVEFAETFADQPFSPARIVLRIPQLGNLNGGTAPADPPAPAPADPPEPAPADPPETPTEGGTDA
ncbi:hypothetical protein ACFVUS_20775 [Nocardia sp. NPDC058058]|uniref:hypothetical protein n=1 Tax=Nocardia sp. NPDC058058 TaxID=3346317 RepID=UPI0036DD5FBA